MNAKYYTEYMMVSSAILFFHFAKIKCDFAVSEMGH